MCMTVAGAFHSKHTQGDDEGSGKVWRRARSDGTLQIVQHVVKRQQRRARRQGRHNHLQVEQRACLNGDTNAIHCQYICSVQAWELGTRKGMSQLILWVQQIRCSAGMDVRPAALERHYRSCADR